MDFTVKANSQAEVSELVTDRLKSNGKSHSRRTRQTETDF